MTSNMDYTIFLKNITKIRLSKNFLISYLFFQHSEFLFSFQIFGKNFCNETSTFCNSNTDTNPFLSVSLMQERNNFFGEISHLKRP